jgi:hypothetical protein
MGFENCDPNEVMQICVNFMQDSALIAERIKNPDNNNWTELQTRSIAELDAIWDRAKGNRDSHSEMTEMDRLLLLESFSNHLLNAINQRRIELTGEAVTGEVNG